jgi:hypothetical protein
MNDEFVRDRFWMIKKKEFYHDRHKGMARGSKRAHEKYLGAG